MILTKIPDVKDEINVAFVIFTYVSKEMYLITDLYNLKKIKIGIVTRDINKNVKYKDSGPALVNSYPSEGRKVLPERNINETQKTKYIEIRSTAIKSDLFTFLGNFIKKLLILSILLYFVIISYFLRRFFIRI